ncbi:hypothetical protein H4R18_005091 [Coemansia javaensis]|uniref:HMG box domain-containing protein n=1 Tax=Coemansia javaensis TaxID=2761396 RepID=A0A9W8H747_9FUNG|nr:hypothetical protein H4R18_005091 [Coemansia javaensis]
MERPGDEVYEFLRDLDLLQYHDAFRHEGFERIESISDIQEADFEALGVKRGHRRLIRRRAMDLVSPPRYACDLPPISPPLLAAHAMHQSPLERAASPVLEEGEPLTAYLHRQHPQARLARQEQHRSPAQQHMAPLPAQPYYTHGQHPKKDPNAPEKWRSAYQLFRDDVNRELQGQDIPFSEMSRIHSKRWAELDEQSRNMYTQRSDADKDEYLKKMAVYEQTDEYKAGQYEAYLEQFYKQDSTVNRVGRPKGAKSAKSKGKAVDPGPLAPERSRTGSPDSAAGRADVI